MERLSRSSIDTVFVTDSIICHNPQPKIRVVSLAPLLAEAINRIHYDISVSELMQQPRLIV
jgi:ribose-phosphate pyrophosphokinase